MLNKQRWAIYNALLERSVNGKLNKIWIKRSLNYFQYLYMQCNEFGGSKKNTRANPTSVDLSHKKKNVAEKMFKLVYIV